MNTESKTDRITQLEIERDEAKVATDFANLRIEQLEAACASMREALEAHQRLDPAAWDMTEKALQPAQKEQ